MTMTPLLARNRLRSVMVRLSDPLGGRVVRSWNTPSVSSPMMRCISGDQQHHHHNVVYPPLNLHNIQGEFGSYAHEYKRSIEDPEGFWKDAAKQITWFQEPETILKPRYDNNPHFWDWFPDGTLNTSYNCLDVHVKNGRGDQIALIYDTPLTGGKKERFTYKELLDLVSKMAGALQSLGVTKGNTVIIYMPLIPQAVVAMLACGRIGAVHSVVFGGFGPSEVATRIDDVRPSVVITASCGVEPTRIVPYRPILEKAFQLSSHQVEKVVVVQRPDIEACKLGARDVDYDLLMASAEPVEAVPVQGTDPSYILSTSGSQGKPKGIVRDTAGHAVALKLSMSSFYGLSPGQTMWTASDIGWVVGHSYIVYGPLLYGCSTVLYEGKPVGTPDAGSFWRVVEEYSVKAMFTAPVAFRAIRQADPQAELAKNYDLSSLQSLFLAGEHSDPETLHYLERALPHIPTPIDHWWMTELGSPGLGNMVGYGRVPVRYGSCSLPVCGYDVQIFDDDGKKLPANSLGNMVIKTPLPPGTMQTIFNDDERFVSGYLSRFPGYFETGDAAFKDEDGYVYAMGRTDDIIQVAAHRLSTGAMEEILLEHPKVADCAVIGVKDSIKGQVPFGFVVCNKNVKAEEYDKICEDLIQMVREELGPVASFKNACCVGGLPKTRSGKILRGTMKKIADGLDFQIVGTIEDRSVFDSLVPAIQNAVKQKKS